MNLFSFFNRAKGRPVEGARRGFGRSGGTFVDSNSAMQVSAFYRGVMYISSQIAKLPWEVKSKDNTILWDDAIYFLLNVAPNNEVNAFKFKLALVQNAIVKGNSYAEIERYPDGRPKALWFLPTNLVDMFRAESGAIWYRVIGGKPDGSDAILPQRDVYHLPNIHLTDDGLNGHGVVSFAIDVLGISLGADRFANSLYSNGGLPSGVLTHPGKLSDAAYARLIDSWKENYGGRKTGGTALLEEGVKYEAISHSPDVLQFLESRKFGVIEISRFLGVPPTKLFDPEATTYNNIEHAGLEVATDTLDTWARNLEAEADVKLLSNQFGGKYTQLDLYAVFRGDMNTRSQYFSRMMQSGAMTPNEIREKEGLSNYPGGDRFYIATNNFTPADRLDEVVDSQLKGKETPAVQTNAESSGNINNELDDIAKRYLEKKLNN